VTYAAAVIDRLSRWETPVVLGCLLFLVVAALVEKAWRDAGEYALMTVVVAGLSGDRESGAWRDRLGRAAFVLGLVGAPVALVANAAEGSWLRAGVWAIASTGLVWLGSGRRVAAEPVTQP
jgi:hypothetical protein